MEKATCGRKRKELLKYYIVKHEVYVQLTDVASDRSVCKQKTKRIKKVP